MPKNQDSSTLSKPTDKGKSIATEEDPTKALIPFLEESGSSPKILDLKSFSSDGGLMTLENAKAQLEEFRRIELLKVEKEKSERELAKLLNPATVKAQTLKLAEYEAKRSKMIKEYNDCITKILDPLPITKISYIINRSTKDATMRITRNNDPTTLTVYEKFALKMLGLTEWIEVHALASKGLKSPSELSDYRITPVERKRKRISGLVDEVFVTKDIRVPRMKRNLIPPPRVVPIQGLVISEPESGIFFMNRNTNIGFQRENEFHLAPTEELIRLQRQIKVDSDIDKEMVLKMNFAIEARKGSEDQLSAQHQLMIKGLTDSTASASNLRDIQVRDIIKEVEDHLKTYSPAEMDIRW
ncbi:hypothetical protein Tco_0389887 [Tanacetum coccineum]